MASASQPPTSLTLSTFSQPSTIRYPVIPLSTHTPKPWAITQLNLQPPLILAEGNPNSRVHTTRNTDTVASRIFHHHNTRSLVLSLPPLRSFTFTRNLLRKKQRKDFPRRRICHSYPLRCCSCSAGFDAYSIPFISSPFRVLLRLSIQSIGASKSTHPALACRHRPLFHAPLFILLPMNWLHSMF